MADLVVDGEYRHAAITNDHLIAEGRAWGLASAADIAEETLTNVFQLANTETPTNGPTPDSPATAPGSQPTC